MKGSERSSFVLTKLQVTDPMVIVGVLGYVQHQSGLRTLTVAWKSYTILDNTHEKRFYRHWHRHYSKLNVEEMESSFVMDDSILEDISSLFDERESDSVERGRT